MQRPYLDLAALEQALDGERAARGMTWAALAREVRISAASLRGMTKRRQVEADAVVLILQWLGRRCDEFVVRPGGAPAPWANRDPLPAPPPLFARFDTIALYNALDRARETHGMGWAEVADELGVSTGTIARFTKGGRTNSIVMVAAAEWAGEPIESLLQPSQPVLGPARMDARARAGR
jgi:hypothetical protein